MSADPAAEDPPPTLFIEDTLGKFRPADPWTSKAAARTVKVRTGTHRYRILAELAAAPRYDLYPGAPGYTAFELAGRLDMLVHVAGVRLLELEKLGLVARTNYKRPTDTGRLAMAWVSTDAGEAALAAAIAAGAATRQADAPRPSSQRPPGRPRFGSAPPSRFRRIIDRVLEDLVAAGAAGRTDVEVAYRLGILRTTAGSTRKQLEEAGYVRRTTRTRPTDRGQPAGVYEVTEAGVERLAELLGLM
jgi:DNA-binding MarR family transcriptional regulator